MGDRDTADDVEWRVPGATASQMADMFLIAHREALLATGVALDSRLVGEVASDFVERSTRTLEDVSARVGGSRCFAVFSRPAALHEVEASHPNAVSHQTLRDAQQEIAVRLSEEAHPLVVSFFDVRASSGLPDVFAVGDSGVSDSIMRGPDWNLRNHRWPSDMGDDFRANPRPALELATLWGLAWLGHGTAPNPSVSAWKGRERGAITRYLETHEPGGADVVVAATVLGVGGTGLAWFITRRLRMDREGHREGPTRIPRETAERLPEMLGVGLDPVDPEAASTEVGLDAATDLLRTYEAYTILSDRVSSRLPAEPTPHAVEAVVPPVEAAALLVLHADLDARARAWKRHVRAGRDPRAADRPRFCAFNPFHGRTRDTAAVRGASASVDVPACTACRDAIGRDEAPDALRVRSGGRTRGYTEVDDGYARSMFGALSPLAPAVRDAPDSGPAPPRTGARAAIVGLLDLVGMPLLILLLAGILGTGVSILLAGSEPEQFLTAAEQAARAAEAGPMLFGYPILNGLRGGAMGGLVAMLFFGIGAMLPTLIRDDPGPADGSGGTGGAAGGETRSDVRTDRAATRLLREEQG